MVVRGTRGHMYQLVIWQSILDTAGITAVQCENPVTEVGSLLGFYEKGSVAAIDLANGKHMRYGLGYLWRGRYQWVYLCVCPVYCSECASGLCVLEVAAAAVVLSGVPVTIQNC